MIVGKSEHWADEPADSQYSRGGRGWKFAHAIYDDKKGDRRNFVVANSSIYYGYRPHIHMARTIFDNMASVISAAEGAPERPLGSPYRTQNHAYKGVVCDL